MPSMRYLSVKGLRQLGLSQSVIDRLPVAKRSLCHPHTDGRYRGGYAGPVYVRLYRRKDIVAWLESEEGQAAVEATVRKRARDALKAKQ